LFSGLLFSSLGVYKFLDNSTYDVYIPYTILGFLLLMPGSYYSFILINIWLGREDYEYEMIPDLSD
jgi:hypothetical protein